MATIMAILGFNCFVVSYSKYLSERDYKAFKNFFQILNL